jgi:L-arabinose isomerase
MKITEQKVNELIDYIKLEMNELKELMEEGYRYHRASFHALWDLKDYVEELFEIKKENENDN